jgi:hypothetical protein
MEPRNIPLWLRIAFNLLAIIGVGATLMGWVKPTFGIPILLFAPIYVLWEIAPWVTIKIRGRPAVSLVAFILVGAVVGAGIWCVWRIALVPTIPVIAPSISWTEPSSIGYGTPLSDRQLDATASTEGTFSYIPDIDTILAVGTHTLTVTFSPRDLSKYSIGTRTVSLIVNPAAQKPVEPDTPSKPVKANAPSPPSKPKVEKPHVILASESERLVLYNKGSKDFYLFGDKFGDFPKDLTDPPVVVPKDGYYYLLNDNLKKWALATIGENGQQFVSFSMFFMNEDKTEKFIGNFRLLIIVSNGVINVHTQMFGVVPGDWTVPTNK